MHRLGLQGRFVLAAVPATAGLVALAMVIFVGGDTALDAPAVPIGALAIALAGLVVAVVGARQTAAALDGTVEAAKAVTSATLLADLATTMATGKRPPAPAAGPDPVAAPFVHMTATLSTRALAAAYEHGEAVRASVSAAVVRLAQHNQRLLDRQLSLLDDLEEAELDPDGLDRLFRLDHLATQMRRRNDALMVLTGAGSGETNAAPVAIRDVLRGAMSSVEDFTRVAIHSSVVAGLRAPAASDLALLLAELIDNATRAAPTSTQVHVAASMIEAGLVLEVVDDGPGFSPTGLREVAALFDMRGAAPGHLPPDRRGLGLVVAARIADRNGFRVTFATNGGLGGRAVVEVPASLVIRHGVDEGSALDDAAVPIVVAQARRHDRLLARQHPQPANGETTTRTETAFVDWMPTAARVPPSFDEVEVTVPAPTSFRPVFGVPGDRGFPTGEPSSALATTAERSPTQSSLYRVATSERSASAGLLGANDRVAMGGLVRRVPGATRRGAGTGAGAGGGATPRPPADAELGPRDPEAIRARLAGYRDGIARGRGGDAARSPGPPANEGWSP